MKELGEITGYQFEPEDDGNVALYCLVRFTSGYIEPQKMASYTEEEMNNLIRFKSRLIHAHPEPLEPKTDWVKYIENL